KITPLNSGGNQENNIRSGTENVAGAVAMAKALRITMDRYEESIIKLNEIQKTLLHKLSGIPEITIHTPIDQKAAPHIINFSAAWMKAETFIHALEQEEI